MSKTNDAAFVAAHNDLMKKAHGQDAGMQSECIYAMLVRVLSRTTGEDLPEYHAGGEAPKQPIPLKVPCDGCKVVVHEEDLKAIGGNRYCSVCRA